MKVIVKFTGKVSETDFNNWENGTNKGKVLWATYDENEYNPAIKDYNPIVRFCSLDEAKEYVESQPEFLDMQAVFEENYPDPEKELFAYYGFYATSKDFIKLRHDANGTYKYKSSEDGSGILTVSHNKYE